MLRFLFAGWRCAAQSRFVRSWLLISVTVLAVASPASAQGAQAGASGRFHRSVCGPAPARAAHCLADVVTNSQGTPVATPAVLPPGYGPADLQNAYNLASAVSAGGGAGKTVAIVDAYHDPNAEADLGVYRQTYGLPACTSANGCFRQVNQNGSSTSPPTTDAGWAQEISLDLDMVSAACPNCRILLVEASSNYMTDLGTAVNTAASLGATAISNSYGGSEYSSETTDESRYFNHPGINVTVSSGDNGYGVEFPAASRYVTAVGGTSLSKTTTSTRGWSETAWSGAGSGCSRYIPQPAWQSVPAGCVRRTVADVSAVADPNTGVAVYDSLPYLGQSGWMVFGGTSVSAPVVASVDALSSSARSLGFSYANPSQFFDVVGGSNGGCSPAYLCTALSGYDGPTGIGSPNGAGASVAPPPAAPSNTSPPAITGSAAQGQTVTASTGVWTNSPTSYIYQWQSCGSSCVPVGTNSATYKVQSTDVGNTLDVIVTASNGVGGSSATSASTPRVAGGQADFTISAPSAVSARRGTITQVSVTVNSVNGFASPTTMSVTGLPSTVSPRWTSNPATPGTPTTLRLAVYPQGQTGRFTVTIQGAAGTLTHTSTLQLTVL